MDPQDMLNLYDREMRRDAPPGRATIYQRPGLTYFTVPPPSPRSGWVLYTRLDPDGADETIRSLVEFFRGHGSQFEWKVYDHDTPADLKDRLRAHGFAAEDPESVLGLDLESTSPEIRAPLPLNVKRLTDRRQLVEVARIEGEVFAEESFDVQAVLGVEMQENPDGISVYVAYVEGVPASTGWIRFHPNCRFGELYGGATLPSQRGKGLYRALVQARAAEARQRGMRFLTVDTSPMSRPILETNGFVFLTHAQAFVMDFSRAPAGGAGGT